MHLLYVKEYMTFESGMIGIVGGIGAVGEDMVRCADQSYIVGFDFAAPFYCCAAPPRDSRDSRN